MRPYSVEIYSPDFQLKQHYNSGEISYKYDYLSVVENSISIKYDQNVTQGDYIWITRGGQKVFWKNQKHNLGATDECDKPAAICAV